ncbi:MAG TPA: hypothetical protein VGC22_05025, partial [Chitinophaga sp.]
MKDSNKFIFIANLCLHEVFVSGLMVCKSFYSGWLKFPLSMKHCIISGLLCAIICLLTGTFVTAQTITTPGSYLVDTRNYYIDRPVGGNAATENSAGINYILLHEAYNGTLLQQDHLVMGRITGVRGNNGEWNRKLTVEVNTASAYTSNRGSIIAYNEPAQLY